MPGKLVAHTDLSRAELPPPPQRALNASRAVRARYLAAQNSSFALPPSAIAPSDRVVVAMHVRRGDVSPARRRDKYRVTDNAWYADLLLSALARHGKWEHVPGARPEEASGGHVRRTDKESGLQLFAAAPGKWCGHESAGSSYFDRLWQTGVSKHSARHERFVLHVRRRC